MQVKTPSKIRCTIIQLSHLRRESEENLYE